MRPAKKASVKARFGAAVRRQRMKLGITQEALAERSGLHRTYIADVERGSRNVSIESVAKIASALGVPIAKLFAEHGGGRDE